MTEQTQDPLRESVQQVASLMDLEAIKAAAENSDPMVRLFQQEVTRGASTEEALARAIDRIATVGGHALEYLGFPPSASISFQIDRNLREAGASELEISAAMTHLLKTGQVDEINGWYFKVPPRIDPESLTQDDIDWLHGTGRFAQ